MELDILLFGAFHMYLLEQLAYVKKETQPKTIVYFSYFRVCRK